MKRNIIDLDKLSKLEYEIENETNEIAEQLNKINQLIELLQDKFKTDDSIKIYNTLKESNLVTLKKYNDKIYNMKVILNKIAKAYYLVDVEFSNKKII